MDYDAIASALATRFTSANVTPPTGLTNIRSSTYLLPQQIGPTPAVLVFPPESDEFHHAMHMRTTEQLWPVRFYIYQVQDMKRQVTDLYKWLSALYDQIDPQVHLGLSTYIASAQIASARIVTVPNAFVYGGDEYDGIEMMIRLNITEAMSPIG